MPPPPKELISSVAKAIGETAGLSLFGFDIIRDSASGKYAVIDLNFFPSYRGVDGWNSALLKLFKSRLN
jgi:glutathione synthase/RimK-type ligase-like ATP-grasp enzyme